MSSQFIYIVSDSTGETAATMIRAVLVQYPEVEFQISRFKNIRQESQLPLIVDEASERKALVIHTIASPDIRLKIAELCQQKGTPSVDLLGPLIHVFDTFLNRTSSSQVGILRAVDEQYFRRIEAIEYTVKHDDGKTFHQLDKADIVLVGISRTSKTPLSIFLSHKGWKVANIPLVLGTPLPEELFKIDQRKVVALMIDIDSLQRIRKSRLEKFGQDPGGEYASAAHILDEIDYAQDLFKKNKKWPVFNVTDRALEETASEIVKIVSARMGYPESALF